MPQANFASTMFGGGGGVLKTGHLTRTGYAVEGLGSRRLGSRVYCLGQGWEEADDGVPPLDSVRINLTNPPALCEWEEDVA